MRAILRATSLLAYVAFLVEAFGVRTARRRRSTGAAGWRRPSSPIDLVGEALCTGGCMATAAAPVGPAIGLGGYVQPPVPVAIAGAAVLLAGVTVALVAQRQLGDDWRPSAAAAGGRALMTAGMFGRVRNPFYVGCALASTGMALVVPGIVSITAAGTVVLAAELVVRWVEEPDLRRAYGPAYERYRRRTGRFLPRLRSSGPSSPVDA